MSVALLFWSREGVPRARHRLSRKMSLNHVFKSSSSILDMYWCRIIVLQKDTKQIDLGLTLGIIISSLWPTFVRNYVTQSAPRQTTVRRTIAHARGTCCQWWLWR